MGVVAFSRSPAPHRVLFLSDVHGKNRDPMAWELFEAFRRAWRPDRIVCLGDLVDFGAVSDHEDIEEAADGTLSDPDADTLDTEIDFAESVFARWRREHPAATLDLIGGNHERFMARYLFRHAPALRHSRRAFNLVEAFKLREHRVSYTPYGTGRGLALPYGPRGLWCVHGSRTGAYPAAAELRLWHRPGLSGHVHRADTAGYRDEGAAWVAWHTLGCLCRLQPSGDWATHPAWNAGWMCAEFWPDTNMLRLEPVAVTGPVLEWRGYRLTWTPPAAPVAPAPNLAPHVGGTTPPPDHIAARSNMVPSAPPTPAPTPTVRRVPPATVTAIRAAWAAGERNKMALGRQYSISPREVGRIVHSAA